VFINQDFTRVAVVIPQEPPWQQCHWSVSRQQTLEQGGINGVRSTHILQFQAGSELMNDAMRACEEIVVLAGSFSDGLVSYKAGTYIKQPGGFKSAVFTDTGCVLFAKQGHLQAADHVRVVVDQVHAQWRQGMVEGLSVLSLSAFQTEHSALVRWQPGTIFTAHRHWGGEEIFVLEGVFEDEYGRYPAGTWLRNPHLSQHAPYSTEGCVIFVKVGHLPQDKA
jgi:anti-sigma factor ChrR (cupin superfamily)